MINRALLIAISYRGSSAELRGCVSDQERLYDYLKSCSPNCEIRVLCDDRRIRTPVYATPTKYNILRQIEWLVSGANSNTHVWISYSGHGGTQRSSPMRAAPLQWRKRNLKHAPFPVDDQETFIMTKHNSDAAQAAYVAETHVLASTDRSAALERWGGRRPTGNTKKGRAEQEEIDNRDETIVPCDFERRGQITDDVLRKRLVDALPEGSKMTAFFDSCHSGTVLDLRYNWTDADASSRNPVIAKSEHNAIPTSKAQVLMLSGCLDNQTSADAFIDNKFCGATTQAFLHHMRRLARETKAAAGVAQRKKNKEKESVAESKQSGSRDFGDKLINDGNLDTLDELLHAMNQWMYDNDFSQRPQISLGRNELVDAAIETFFPLIE